MRGAEKKGKAEPGNRPKMGTRFVRQKLEKQFHSVEGKTGMEEVQNLESAQTGAV